MTPPKPRSRIEEEARRLNDLRRQSETDAGQESATPVATTDAPACPRCGRVAVDESDETSGSSSRWLACNACGFHWRARRR